VRSYWRDRRKPEKSSRLGTPRHPAPRRKQVPARQLCE
jgi:hypothetical protein